MTTIREGEMAMTPAVCQALDEIAKQFPGRTISTAEDKNGGALVIVEDQPLGAPYREATSWIGFHVTHNAPYADVYPHFVRGDITRTDGAALGEGMTTGHTFPQPDVLREPSKMPPRQAVQVSRRSNRRDTAGLETPLIKLLKVLTWIKSR
jgi:hypothetical protein